MSHASLTAKYRPQTFADVAGQETVKAILSRAAAENRVAPAYLFSGTRGVGKTTIARIFAKALNCTRGPAAEPCNECEQCRKITQGMAVDVVEIDGASNRGIDDAKRLKEAIGYAPMEGRYKVFIIDEAHMLTREAFNALLKTLEEPPANVTFVMATTEPHKFPVTIVSRCQHFIFKRLTENGLAAHLVRILEREGTGYESEAVKLIARRAAGSVRDSMSLLGQVLALGSDSLTVADARGILGLAGQELFFRVADAIRRQDCVGVSTVLRDVLDQGLDLGFFLRELTGMWRNLFMLRQAGESALPLLDLPEEEARQWLEWAPQFALSHIHACWQMTLEGQRRVLNSLEPAMALELLLLNLAFMPRLLGMQQASQTAPAPVPVAGDGPAPSGGSSGTPPAGGHAAPPRSAPSVPSVPDPAGTSGRVADAAKPQQQAQADSTAPPPAEDAPPGQSEPSGPATWEGFAQFCLQQNGQDGKSLRLLRQIKGELRDGVLHITPAYQMQRDRLTQPEMAAALETLARSYWGAGVTVAVGEPTEQRKAISDLRKELDDHPAVQLLKEELGARVLAVRYMEKNNND
ncbi:DNA polymerase III subunit gamma/tau [Oleidesulfovibrio alaskensis]|uniref:DNA polymerase III subunit gamma/tau n=1 Tax=Oleidesulfovibrio alaskensis TaxID=58180 RepID=UPI001E160FD0|nr:DNA polymerase III subunit gamma/tau [Oleidesulfovibrio alaskensis]MBG0774334.1 DNA polymerase III subunit gamma/tau [Oleidesulfovibrio alaskensis]